MAGIVFFNWVFSYADDGALYYIEYAKKAKIYRDGELRYMTASDFYGEFFIYTFNLAFKSAMNVAGWIIAFMFYGDFCDHCDYMIEFLYATPEDLLDAEHIRCVGKIQHIEVDPEYCEEMRLGYEARREAEKREADQAAADEQPEEEFTEAED